MKHSIKTRILCFFTGGFLWSLVACHSVAQQKEAAADASPKSYAFTLPAIPDTLTDVAKRADFLVAHYWESFDFADTAYVHLPHISEQAFADYLNILPYASDPVATQSIPFLLQQAEKEASGRMYAYFLELFDKYLYDPNSPVRDDEKYLFVVQYILSDSRSDGAEKIRKKYTLEQIMKNRRGETAADFAYVTPDGKQGRLHGVRANYTILMFYNPDCHACGEIIAAMKASKLISKLQAGGTVAVLLFYPDEDMDIWKKHLSDIPAQWINGYDPQTAVENDEIYDLRAIPTLYLLDKEKKVLLKDVNLAQLEKWLADKFPLMAY
jgi:hypothetical protein